MNLYNKMLKYIYCVTNTVNNKKFIGITTDIERRWREFEKHLNSEKYQSHDLYKDMNEYGFHKFSYEILETLETNEYNLRNYIIQYNSFIPDGYNILENGVYSTKGFSKKTHTTELRNKMTKHEFACKDTKIQKKYICCDCSKPVNDYKTKRCFDCRNKFRFESKYNLLHNRPSYEQLLEDLKSSSYTKVGKKYGVSDNTIRKWIKVYEKYKK